MDIEKWNIDNLVDACSPKPFGNKRMKIPSVQRLRAWTKEQENELIETLKLNKISIGTLQVYKLDPSGKKETYLLADGLNRCTTLVNYFNDPLSFDLARRSIKAIEDELVEKYKKSHEASSIQTLCSKWFNKDVMGSYKDFVMERTFNEKTDELIEIVTKLVDKKDKDNIYKMLLTKTKDLCKELDISKSVICVIVNEDITTLPLLFKRINQNGTPLSTCDVLAATWADKEVEILNPEIISCIKDHYNDMKRENNGMEIYSITAGKYTAYDYVNGLSRHLLEKYENTFYANIGTKDKEFVFKLLTCALIGDITKKSIAKLDEELIKENFTTLEETLYWVFDYASEVLDPLVLVRVNTKEGYIVKNIVKEVPFYIGLMTYLFINKTKISKKLDDLKTLIRLNLINDKLSDTSFNAKLIRSLVEDRRYANKLSLEDFTARLTAHSEKTIKSTKSKVDMTSQLVLKFMNILTMNENDSLEFGTIIARKELNDFNKDNKEFLPVNAFGNIAVYDYSGVPKKPSESVVKYLRDQNVEEDIIYKNYIYVENAPGNDELVVRQLITKKNYLKFLRYRTKCIKDMIISNCGNSFESDNDDENADDNVEVEENNDEEENEENIEVEENNDEEEIEEEKAKPTGKMIKFTKPTGKLLTK
jgi:hypothetical protein